MNKNQLLILGFVIVIFAAIAIVIFSWNMTSSGSAVTSAPANQTQPASPISQSSSSSPSLPIVSYEYHVGLPNALMLVDSQGRRTGEDPITGVTYHEIPGSSYSNLGSVTSSPKGAGELFFSEPLGWEYTLYVLGGQTGTYWADLRSDYQNHPELQRLSGDIQAGSMIEYMPNYNLNNPASSTLILVGTSSTTASITSAPPHNLPPPPIP